MAEISIPVSLPGFHAGLPWVSDLTSLSFVIS